MKVLTKHPHAQGVTYTEHWTFAMGIAWRLLRSALAFVIHANLTFITIERRFDLEAVAGFLLERNRFIESQASKAADRASAGPGNVAAGSFHAIMRG